MQQLRSTLRRLDPDKGIKLGDVDFTFGQANDGTVTMTLAWKGGTHRYAHTVTLIVDTDTLLNMAALMVAIIATSDSEEVAS